MLALALGLLVLAWTLPGKAQGQDAPAAQDDLGDRPIPEQVRTIAQEYEAQSGGQPIPEDQLRHYLEQVHRSDWTFAQVRDDIARSLVGRDTIRCESDDQRSRTCPTPWTGPSRLVRQLSETPCVEDGNWSAGHGEIAVWAGCRAEFAPLDAPPGPILVRCESHDRHERTCATPWPGRTRLVRELSDTSCIEGRNWRYRPGEVTVWAGCRAEFAAVRAGGGPGDTAYSVTCASRNRRYTTCYWAPRHGRPRVIEQLSRESCIRGESWGMVDPSTIWVSHGCRARFGN